MPAPPPVPQPQWLTPNNLPPLTQFYPRQTMPNNQQQSKDAVAPFRESSKSPPIKRVAKSGKKGDLTEHMQMYMYVRCMYMISLIYSCVFL